MEAIPFTTLYVEYAKNQTDAPEEFHRFLAYLVLAATLNKNVYLQFGFRHLYPNLYLLIVAPSSAHRKSWSMSIATRLIKKIYPDYLLPEVSSREAFVSEICDTNRIPLGCGLLKIDELKGFLDRLRNRTYMDGFLQDLSSLYDGETINRRKGIDDPQRYRLENPYLNLMAACSNTWLYESIQAGDISGGFFARFIWLLHDEPVLQPSPWPTSENQSLFLQCLAKLSRISMCCGEMSLSPGSRTLYEEWFRSINVKYQGGIWDANYHRAPAIVAKIAMLNAIAREEAQSPTDPFLCPTEIGEEDMSQAITLITTTYSHLHRIVIGVNKGHTLAKKVLKFVSDKNGEATRTEILQGVHGISAKMLTETLDTLKQADAVQMVSWGKGQMIKTTPQAENYLAS